VRDPEQALAAARAAAAAQAASASAPAEEPAPWSLEDPVRSSRRLAEWAIIEPSDVEVYSTRRLGAPITVVKRLLIRLLAQYIGQVSAQQSRFNAQIAAHVLRLEERVQVLEEAAQERSGGARERPGGDQG
jgi:hypothetical protein